MVAVEKSTTDGKMYKLNVRMHGRMNRGSKRRREVKPLSQRTDFGSVIYFYVIRGKRRFTIVAVTVILDHVLPRNERG